MKKILVGKHAGCEKIYTWDIPEDVYIPSNCSGDFAIVENKDGYAMVEIITCLEFDQERFQFLDVTYKNVVKHLYRSYVVKE